jgi:hypothetical protein
MGAVRDVLPVDVEQQIGCKALMVERAVLVDCISHSYSLLVDPDGARAVDGYLVDCYFDECALIGLFGDPEDEYGEKLRESYSPLS